ncbi:type II toxin-antitoxin system prevent-host-death family antitoxin [Candidatus Collierbacteria bacterium]|nr:type II toxin-antitoxin system prevent-host-death family antitoxin [Candidatus Collierbacteria bacterium]
MNTITLSATEARNQFFPLIDRVFAGEFEVRIVKNDTKSVVTVAKATIKKEKTLTQLLKETHGILKDIPESDFYDDRLHGKRAKEFLDKLRSQ